MATDNAGFRLPGRYPSGLQEDRRRLDGRNRRRVVRVKKTSGAALRAVDEADLASRRETVKAVAGR